MTDAKPYTSKDLSVALNFPRVEATVEALERAERERDCWKAICGREDGYHPLHVREAVRLLDMERCRAAATQTSEFIKGMQDAREEQRARAERAEGELAAAQNHLLRAERAERDLNRQLAAVTAERDRMREAHWREAIREHDEARADAARLKRERDEANADFSATAAAYVERLAKANAETTLLVEVFSRITECKARLKCADHPGDPKCLRCLSLTVTTSDSWLAEVRATARDEALEEAATSFLHPDEHDHDHAPPCGACADEMSVATRIRALKRGGK